MTGMNFNTQDPDLDAEGLEESAGNPLIPGVDREQGFGADPTFGVDEQPNKSRSLASGLLPIFIIAAVAGGAIFFMRSTAGDADRDTIATEVRAKIDQAVAKLSNENAMAHTDPLRADNIDNLFKDTETVVAMFATDFTENQVPVQYVKKNPFVLDRPKTAEGKPAETGDDRRRYEQWLAGLKRDIHNLRLDAVMGGAQPMAIVDGKPVHVGDTVGRFEVEAIQGQTMRLRAVYEPTGKNVLVNLKMPG